jgi:hypothetical protein
MRLSSVLFSTLLLGCAVNASAEPGLFLRVHDAHMEVEVARTEAERQTGLMRRQTLADDGGMLFVFPVSGRHCFWMKDTPLPLSVAFLDDAGTVIQIGDMEPLSESLHCVADSARYAIEMNAGWFRRHAVTVGDRVTGLPPAP